MKNQEIDYNEEEFCDERLPEQDKDGIDIIPIPSKELPD